jgi:hypothetical protein
MVTFAVKPFTIGTGFCFVLAEKFLQFFHQFSAPRKKEKKTPHRLPLST